MATFPPIYSTETYDPLNSLGRHIVDLAAKMRNAIDRRATGVGISGAQWVILIRLGASGDAGVNAAELCRSIGYDSGSMTRMLDRLEKRGMVYRERSVEDRRVVRAFLTAQGRELYPQLTPMAIETLNAFLRGFSREEMGLLMGFLERMLANDVTAS